MFAALCQVIELTVEEEHRQRQVWETRRRWEHEDTIRRLKKQGLIKSEADLYPSGHIRHY